MGNEETLGAENAFGQDCYDAIWILALALNKTMNGTYLNISKHGFALGSHLLREMK